MALLPAAEAAQVLRGLIWPAEGLVPRTLLSAALGTPPRRDLGVAPSHATSSLDASLEKCVLH